jgi:membrane protein YdbS with pleckstrin-like domain
MKTIITFFDYTYYRVTKFYVKWEGRKGVTGIFAVGMLQLLLIGIPINLFTRFGLGVERSDYAGKIAKNAAMLLLIVILILNFKKYYGKFNTYRYKWENETHSTLKGYLVILSLVIPWIIIIYIGAKT